MHLQLIQRDDCQLCDEAMLVLAQVGVPDFDSVWIDDDSLMESRYGMRVPVLRDDANDRELDWPFDVTAVQRWLAPTKD